ncbi:MAG: hypothetical protein M1836_001473 [Candelina mexicana]|nr:MAG: hypothetical protein M1836_001473 [Candelina mexicana]
MSTLIPARTVFQSEPRTMSTPSDTSTPIPPGSIFRFYELPPELRELILKNLLLSKTRFVDPGGSKGPMNSYVAKQPYVSSTILRVNRQIYTQGIPLLYSKNSFRFVTGALFRSWTEEASIFASRTLIRDVIVHVSIHGIVGDFPGIDGRRTLLCLTYSNFPYLERLTLAFQDPVCMGLDKKKELVRRIGSVDFKNGLKELKLLGLELDLKKLLMEELRHLEIEG